MNNTMKKITMIAIATIIMGLSLVGCGEEKSILLTENYLKANWDNNYEEVDIKAKNLGEDFEVKSEDHNISIIDKKSKDVDKIEYIFGDTDDVVQINLRSNSKSVYTKKYGTAMLFYIEEGKMVDSQQTQIDFLNGKIVDDKVLDIDNVLLEAYSGVAIENVIYETRFYLEEFEDDIYEFKEEKDVEEVNIYKSILTNKKSNSRVVIRYAENPKDEHAVYLMNRISYELADGRKLEINIKDGEKIESFKIYNKGDSKGEEVESFGSQVNFLKGR